MNMHKPPKTKSTTTSTHQGHALSRHSLPMTLFSTTKRPAHVHTDHLVHPEEQSIRPEDQTLCRYEKPCNMPHLGSTANGHESLPSCTTGQHAGLPVTEQKSPVAIHHRQQDCYTPPWGSKENTTIYFGWRPQEIFRLLPQCLGMCPAWRGEYVPFLHPKMSPLVRRFLQDVSLQHKSHPRQALAALHLASANVMALIHTPPDKIVCLTAIMSNLNIPSDAIKDDQMGVYTDKMD